MAFTIKENDTRPRFVVGLLEDVGGPGEGPIDLTDATSVQFFLREVGAAPQDPPKVDAPATITDAVNGEVTYTWATGDTDTAGDYEAEVQILWDDGGIETVPNATYWEVTVVVDLGD